MAPQFSIETKKIIMDTKLVREFGTEILSYRLRTVRQKKRMQYEDFDKKLIRLKREEDELYVQEKNLGWEPLIPPVQKGWKRFYILRNDVARSKHAAFFENILKKINTYEWSYRRDFKVKKRKMGRKQYVVKVQNLLEPCEDHFRRLGFTDVEKTFFYEVWKWNKHRRQLEKHFVFGESWRFVLRVRPNMITKIKRIDPAIESRRAEIKSYFDGNAYEYRWCKIRGGDVWQWWHDYPADRLVKNVLKNKPLPKILDEVAAGLL
jgi:hypothetical protein